MPRNTRNNPSAFLTIKEVARELVLSEFYVRQLVKKGKLPATHDETGKVQILRTSLLDYVKGKEQKEQQRKQKILAQLEGKHERPTTVACRRIRAQIQHDTDLSDDLRATFIAAIKRYEEKWDAAYAAKHPDEA